MSKPVITELPFHDKRGEPLLMREARLDDAAALLRMIRAVVEERLPGILWQPEEFDLDEAAERDFLKRHRESERDAVFLVMRGDDEVVGVLNGMAARRLRLAHTWRLGMSVAKPFRGRGVGRVLLKAAVDYVAAHPELAKIALEVTADNTAAYNLYRKLGFEEEGRLVNNIRRQRADGGFDYVDQVQMFRWLG